MLTNGLTNVFKKIFQPSKKKCFPLSSLSLSKIIQLAKARKFQARAKIWSNKF